MTPRAQPPPACTWLSPPPQAHLEVLEAQLAAEELVLLPHVLLQVPEEAKRRQRRALWALMLKQLPRETPKAPDPVGTRWLSRVLLGPALPHPRRPPPRCPASLCPRSPAAPGLDG